MEQVAQPQYYGQFDNRTNYAAQSAGASQIFNRSGNRDAPSSAPNAIYDGERTVRDRDAFVPEYSRPRTVEVEPPVNPHTTWNTARHNRMRPVTFQPNGSFKCLKEQGKLTDPAAASRSRDMEPVKKSYMPGYTGFVRGAQHISGRTYGETTRRALDTDYVETVCTSPIPSSPQANRRVQQITPPNSFVTNAFGDRNYHVPGYTGFVPGVRATYATTYGSSTEQELYAHSLSHPRPVPQERDGFAATARPRQMLNIDSAPLPGGTKTQLPPDKLIPAHLRYLRFFPM